MQKELFKHSSNLQTILLIAKYFKRPITYYDLKYMNPKAFNHKSHVDRSFFRLSQLGLMIKTSDNSWHLTVSGLEYVKTSAKGSYRPEYSKED